MQTDIPLKRLTALRSQDLLPLLGTPNSTVESVQTVEQPAGAKRLDAVLEVRSPNGQRYLHIIEWQGYHDAAVLWRFASYLAWFGEKQPQTPVIGTVIYLSPAADVGTTISAPIDGVPSLGWQAPCIRLWELDAEQALTTGGLAGAVLSPLMNGANEALVDRAAALVMQQAPAIQQGDLLSILGIFAAPFLNAETFVERIGKDKLMATDLLTYLVEEKLAEVEAQHRSEIAAHNHALAEKDSALAEKDSALAEKDSALAEKDSALAAYTNEMREVLQGAVENVLLLRFPHTNPELVQRIAWIESPAQLKLLNRALMAVPDQAAAEFLLDALPNKPAHTD